MGKLVLGLVVNDGKLEVQSHISKCNSAELSLAFSYLEIMKDNIKREIIKLGNWDFKDGKQNK